MTLVDWTCQYFGSSLVNLQSKPIVCLLKHLTARSTRLHDLLRFCLTYDPRQHVASDVALLSPIWGMFLPFAKLHDFLVQIVARSFGWSQKAFARPENSRQRVLCAMRHSDRSNTKARSLIKRVALFHCCFTFVSLLPLPLCSCTVRRDRKPHL